MTGPFKTLEDLLKHGAEFAADCFKKAGGLEPMWICQTMAGELIIVGGEMPDHMGSGRDKLALVLKKVFHEHNVVRYVFMTEAWSYEGTEMPASIKAGASIESHPDRRELISLAGEDKSGKHLIGAMYILRPEQGPAKLSEFKIFASGHVGGRFARLLLG